MRIQLANLLALAAELEHDVMCQYLFAAFSMKRHPDEGRVSWQQLELMRRWQGDLLLIARQEMEHLGIVSNLLTAIGEAPRFARPSFPVRAREFPVPDPLSLEPFGVEVVARLLAFESPAEPSEAEEIFLTQLEGETGVEARRISKTLGQLYGDILSLFKRLPHEDLFIGPQSAQLGKPNLEPPDAKEVDVSAIRGLKFGEDPPPDFYGLHLYVVRDLQTAKIAIRHIVEEGEGRRKSKRVPRSHFKRLQTISEQLSEAIRADPDFRPARRVGANPRSAPDSTAGQPPERIRGVTWVTHPETLRVSRLFDLAYETTVMMLIRLFGHPVDATDDDRRALQHAVFFPMMTSVIRPLGEVLTQLPAKPGSSVRAGPSFLFGPRLAFLPHRDAACLVLHRQLEAMRDRAEALRHRPSDSVLEPFQERLGLIHEDLGRMAIDFGARTGLVKQP